MLEQQPLFPHRHDHHHEAVLQRVRIRAAPKDHVKGPAFLLACSSLIFAKQCGSRLGTVDAAREEHLGLVVVDFFAIVVVALLALMVDNNGKIALIGLVADV